MHLEQNCSNSLNTQQEPKVSCFEIFSWLNVELHERMGDVKAELSNSSEELPEGA